MFLSGSCKMLGVSKSARVIRSPLADYTEMLQQPGPDVRPATHGQAAPRFRDGTRQVCRTCRSQKIASGSGCVLPPRLPLLQQSTYGPRGRCGRLNDGRVEIRAQSTVRRRWVAQRLGGTRLGICTEYFEVEKAGLFLTRLLSMMIPAKETPSKVISVAALPNLTQSPVHSVVTFPSTMSGIRSIMPMALQLASFPKDVLV
ncbi:hypothetical protein QBC47DRAFT_196821 [Echria macrotheca]|uniref:Uncharacterized protein n=1 Tax=Echria macrotheca TaxID=438768 RepID=A0AAJ0F6K9_9PEZI|nr:hypothetical protein QBC47DRAFT_196821 [Echria macrotheca]